MNLGLSAVFLSYPNGFVCGNSAAMGTEADVVNTLDGKSKSVKRKKTLRVKDSFIHGRTPEKGEEVTCLTKLTIGNIFIYHGYIDYVSPNGYVGVIITSNAILEGVPELIEVISGV